MTVAELIAELPDGAFKSGDRVVICGENGRVQHGVLSYKEGPCPEDGRPIRAMRKQIQEVGS